MAYQHGIRSLISFFLFAFLAGPAYPQLIDPGWEDPLFATYLEDPDARRGNLLGTSGGLGAGVDESIVFSLPVFSLQGSGEVTGGLGAGDVDIRQTVPGWPGCAAREPSIITVPEVAAQSAGLKPGSWYSRTLDYGCIVAVIEGDQNQPDLTAGSRVPGLERSGNSVVTYQGGDADEPLVGGIPTIGLRAGNLVYSMTVYCVNSQSLQFCADEGSLMALPRALVVVAGLPDG